MNRLQKLYESRFTTKGTAFETHANRSEPGMKLNLHGALACIGHSNSLVAIMSDLFAAQNIVLEPQAATMSPKRKNHKAQTSNVIEA